MSDWGATQRVSARVLLAEGVVLTGEMHLLSRTASTLEPETPLEMLNREDPFFALSLADGGVAFVSKAQVSVVSCKDHSPLLDDPDRATAAKLVALAVELTDGVEYRGRSTFELPPAHARALDYINGPGRFFALGNEDVTQYINKSQVRLIRPLD